MKIFFILSLSIIFVLPLFADEKFVDEKLIYVFAPDKTCLQIRPAWDTQKPTETEEEFIARRVKESTEREDRKNGKWKDCPYEIVYKSELPNVGTPLYREYRLAWEGEKGKGIKINQQKKQAIIDKKNAKKNAKNKLKALGLNDEEVMALVGE
jgi:hypothetical protein